MKQLILVKYGEIILKGNNRPIFEAMLMKNIRRSLYPEFPCKVQKKQAAIYVELEPDADIIACTERLQKIFGITKISPAYAVKKDIEQVTQQAIERFSKELQEHRTFKVEAKRADKKFPVPSPQICAQVGGSILEAFPHLKVDVHNPQISVVVDVRDEHAYLYCQRIPGAGGMPTGSNGKGMLLLSGGIDSPVAGYLMAKRGLIIEGVNFFSYPYTSERAKQKVIDLAKILRGYTGAMKLHIVPFTDIQLAIRDHCPEEQLTLIMRRMMTRIAQRIAEKSGAQALITGESLGQVASQTIGSIAVTNSVADIPVLRPLIGLDKEEIISFARKIGTFETSILPYEDCCTLFVPKHPNTRPVEEKIAKSELNLEMDKLIEDALCGTEIIEV